MPWRLLPKTNNQFLNLNTIACRTKAQQPDVISTLVRRNEPLMQHHLCVLHKMTQKVLGSRKVASMMFACSKSAGSLDLEISDWNLGPNKNIIY